MKRLTAVLPKFGLAMLCSMPLLSQGRLAKGDGPPAYERIVSPNTVETSAGHSLNVSASEVPILFDPGHVPPPQLGEEPLPPLDEELWLHGGSYLYAPEGDRLNCPPSAEGAHSRYLRLPEWWEKPEPITHHQEFLGADPIHPRPGLQWCGPAGFQWEPRFVGHGSYELFGIALEDAGNRQDGIGHQLLVDLDLRLTGTERFHVQFRPVGRKNSGGSFWQLNDPQRYVDNSTGVPDRYWFEGEFFSIFGGALEDEFKPRDYHFVFGKFPFALHNSLLINDDILGVVVNKNTIIVPPLSNLNVQVFAGLDDVDNIVAPSPNLWGIHLTADWRSAFLEASYVYLDQPGTSALDAHYGAASATQFFGPMTLAGRILSKWGDKGGRGDGQLYVLESNLTRSFHEEFTCCTGIEYGVFYANLFKATAGWNSISGGNFDRLRSTFEVDPLVSISRGQVFADTFGAAVGVQLFRHEEDESIIPEIAWEEPSGTAVWGVGLRYLRKLGSRTFLEARGVRTWSDARIFQREGVFVSTTWIL